MHPDRYAVIGHPIAHSLSPQIHALFAAQTGQTMEYAKLEAPLEGFEQFVKGCFASGCKGCNVTLPFKAEAAALADVRSPRAERAGAANTLWLQHGKLHADNTDGAGLMRDLTVNLGVVLHGRRLLVIGAGGAVAGVCASLLESGIAELTIANRTLSKAQEIVATHEALAIKCGAMLKACPLGAVEGEYDLVINAVSAGLSTELVLPSESVFRSNTYCYDMLYSLQRETPFINWARLRGLPSADGLGMLVEQAAESFYIWRGIKPSTTPVLEALRSTAGCG
jgi:shikimate dehydrogenase